jgi:Dyp-type peroxidase family
MGGVNLVAGFRPTLWAEVAGANAPRQAADFTEDVSGRDGYTMPATQHDVMMWVAGASYDLVFDVSIAIRAALCDVAVLVEETAGWSYHRDLDLTGFIDGTENPSLSNAPAMVLVPDGKAGAGSTLLLLQKWEHDAAAWSRLPVAEQEAVTGRTKLESVELDDRPATSHAARTDQDQFGHIFRRNTPYGTVLNPRHDVRWVQRRTTTTAHDATKHGRCVRRARCADLLLAAADRCLLVIPSSTTSRVSADSRAWPRTDPHQSRVLPGVSRARWTIESATVGA